MMQKDRETHLELNPGIIDTLKDFRNLSLLVFMIRDLPNQPLFAKSMQFCQLVTQNPE